MAITVLCPSCRTRLTLGDDRAGETLECPKCDAAMTVPLPAAPTRSSSPPPLPVPAATVPDEDDQKPWARPRTRDDDDEDSRPVRVKTKYCHECGEQIRARAEICPKCGVRQPGDRRSPDQRGDPALRQAAGNKLAAGLCGILLGYLGIHKFILGFTTPGIILLLVTVLTCGWGAIVTWVIGLVEGIIYLTKSDEEFYETYVVDKKSWF